MKKRLAMLLALVLLLGLCACAAGGDAAEPAAPAEGRAQSGFRVGYARVSIQPTEELPLGGYGNTTSRISTGFLNYLYATCIAITDEQDNTVLLFTTDEIRSSAQITSDVRAELKSLTGVPEDHIMVAGTHSHSTPDIASATDAATKRFENYMKNQLVLCGQQALEDQKNAEVFTNSVDVAGLNFVRHYLLEDGSYAGSNFGDFSAAPIKQHATEADPTMYVIKFAREGAQDIVMLNWRVHPVLTGGMNKYDISSDFIGEMRDQIESKTDTLVAYFQGDAGNINPTSMIDGETLTDDYRMYGQMVGSYAIGALNDMTQVEPGLIQTKQIRVAGEVNHTTDELYDKADELSQMWNSGSYDRETIAEEGKPYGIRSAYQAVAIVRRAKMAKTLDLELNVITVGDSLGFVTAPYEMFDTNGAAIRAASPYPMTMVLGYCNGALGYIPSAFGYEYTCYESDTSNFAPGTGELLQDTFISALNELHG